MRAPQPAQDARPPGGGREGVPTKTRGLAITLCTMADTGRGIWLLLGTALAFGLFRQGRGNTLVLLALGSAFVLAGLAAALLRRAGDTAWHGWRPRQGFMPTPAALFALAGFLPVLAVAGLSRGDNDFWATRIAGATLMICSLGALIGSVAESARGLSLPMAQQAMLPTGRVMAALYGGGLWFWVSSAATGRLAVTPILPHQQPWLLALLIMALLLGLIEGMRWHVLHAGDSGDGRTGSARVAPARFMAALLGYAVPCVALLVSDHWQAGGLLALVAALSALAGRVLEQRLFADVASYGMQRPH